MDNKIKYKEERKLKEIMITNVIISQQGTNLEFKPINVYKCDCISVEIETDRLTNIPINYDLYLFST